MRLKLVARIDTIDQETVRNTYPKLCDGLGLVRKPYTIKLKPDAKPFSLKVPRRVPLPLMGKVKKELERMENLGVIEKEQSGGTHLCGHDTPKCVSVRRKVHPPFYGPNLRNAHKCTTFH